MHNLVFFKMFGPIEDPRIDRNKLYPLPEILLVALAAIISGATTYEDIKLFGELRLNDFLRKLMPFKNGIPSVDTFERVFKIISPRAMREALTRWVEAIQEVDPLIRFIAIDGKTVRGSASMAKGKSPLNMLNAFASKNRRFLAAHAVDPNSNEITAIPKILDVLYLKGAIVTIDAIGAQTGILEQIVAQRGDAVISLKGNQGTLLTDVKEAIQTIQQTPKSSNSLEQYSEIDKAHGRIEERNYGLLTDKDSLRWLKEEHPHWNKINAVGFVRSRRIIGEKETEETRYFITTLKQDVKLFAQAIRSHWAIESSHWTLDVIWREDASRILDRNAAENISILRRIGMNIVERDTSKGSKKGKKLRAGWDHRHLLRLLTQTTN